MKVLFIDACTGQQSRTHALAMAFMAARYTNNQQIQTVSLFSTPFAPLTAKQLAARNADIAAGLLDGKQYAAAWQFAQSDEIVIAAPYWDCSFPAVLKAYFEHICVNGITFGYNAEGKPLALVRAARLTYITTSGGYIPKQSSLNMYINELCNMFGIQHTEFYSAQGLDIMGNNPQQILSDAAKAFNA